MKQGSLSYVPNPPIIFLVIAVLGRRMMSNQKGCGKKVATVKAEWMGSDESGTSAVAAVAVTESQVEASERTSGIIMDRRVLLIPAVVARMRLGAGRAW
jgi:hypothetical protein